MNKLLNEEITIEKLIPGGQALGTLQSGKKIFLWNALPGEIVTQVQISQEKSSYAEGVALEYKRPSERRVAPHDTCYLSTSPWQIMQYAYELDQKQQILQEIFRQHQLNITNVEFNSVQTDGKDYFYRNKMEYALFYSHEDQLIHPAFRGRGSHRKIPVSHSSLERPEIWQAAQTRIDELNQQKADARQFQSLLLRSNQNREVAGGFFINHQPRPRFQHLTDHILGYEYSYSPNGFFQINLPVYEMALRAIQPWIKTAKVLDLYAGVGTIGLSVARDHDLTLVECDKSAYRELEKNCQGTTAHPVWAKSEEALDYILQDQTVILDPPRAGIHADLAAKLLEVEPQAIIYLSCNPVTQARDVKILTAKYNIKNITPFNFFPRTPHLENLMILEHK